MTTIPPLERVDFFHAAEARGVVVVIDVIRAFSVAAYALAGGARALWLVRTAEEAFALRQVVPDALLAGEISGRMIEGFDHNNSPARMAAADVRGRLLIQRTGAGTQGAVGAAHAPALLMCSLVNARATARAALSRAGLGDLPITFLPTGLHLGPDTIEDGVCADYIAALIERPDEAEAVLAAGLHNLRTGPRLALFSAADSDFPVEDVEAVLAVDRFDFAMPGIPRHEGGITYIEVIRED